MTFRGVLRITLTLMIAGIGTSSIAEESVPPEHDYLLHCSGCHLADGRGAPDSVPSLQGLDRFLASTQGRAYLIRAPGVAQAPIDDARLAALMNWVVVELGGATSSPEYTASEVAQWRNEPLRDPTEVRARLLEAAEE